MAARLPVIALTSGEPAGIGPDLALMLAHEELVARVVVIGDESLLAGRARCLGLNLAVRRYAADGLPLPGSIRV